MSEASEHENPFAAPLASDSPTPLSSISPGSGDAEFIRNELLGAEASIKSIGTVYLLVGGLWALAGLTLVGVTLAGERFDDPQTRPFIIAGGAIITLLGAASVWCAFGLRRLDPAVRIWVIVVQSACLILHLLRLNIFAVGVSIYILIVMAGNKGKRVLSTEYQEVVAATPHIKRKTSIVVWILLGLLLLLAIGGFMAAVLGE